MKTEYADLERIVDAREMESRTLEFKGALPPSNEREKKEFLKDVSSMANSIGGKIIFGIGEARVENQKLGCADQMIQFTIGELSKTKELFLNWLSSGCDPKMPGITISEVINPDDPDFGLLVADIPQSWLSPHMVRETGHFYYRTSGGCDRMDTAQLRDLFLVSDGIATQTQRFHNDRVGKIMSGEMPVAAKQAPTLVIHCIPLTAFTRNPHRISFNSNDCSRLPPPGQESGWNWRRNIDGFLTTPAYSNGRSYLQAFSNGILECMSQLFYGNDGLIYPAVIERTLFRFVETSFKFYQLKQIEAPIVCIPTLLRVRGMNLSIGSGFRFPGEEPTPIDRDVVFLPEKIFESIDISQLEVAGGKLPESLVPTIEGLWHSGGFEGRPHR